MSREYSENVLVQNSAGNLLQNVLGWEVVMAYNSEKLGPDGTLGRTSYGEVLLTRYFRQALLRLNPWLTPNQLDEVQKKFTAHVSTASLMQINEEKYFLLRDGIPVTVKRPDGRTETRSAAVIDFKNPENNHFLAVKEMKIHSQLYRCRTDIVGFVNGIPLLFIELKKPTVDVQNAYIEAQNPLDHNGREGAFVMRCYCRLCDMKIYLSTLRFHLCSDIAVFQQVHHWVYMSLL